MRWGFLIDCDQNACKGTTYSENQVPGIPLVTAFESNELLVLVVGRLYYQQDWSGKLSVIPSSNAELAGAIYVQLGLKALEAIEGEFALVLVDKKGRQLHAMRDPMGAYPLYWLSLGGRFLISTGIEPLLGQLSSQRINLEYIADYLLVAGSQSELPSEHCVYEEIHRLLPGSLITWTARDNQVRKHCYWNWLERLIYPDNDDINQAAEAVREVLSGAVNQRMIGRTAAHLSGGMDSTTIAMLAQKAQHRTEPLHTISLVFTKLESLSKETPYIQAALADLPEAVPHIIEADEILDFDAFRDPPTMDEPYPGLWRLAMDRATINSAIESGAATLLTGLGADEIFHMEPYHVTDLMRRGRVIQAWRESANWAYAMQWNVWQVFYPFAIENLFPAWNRIGFGRLLSHPKQLAKKNALSLPSWINTSFAQSYDLKQRSIENVRRTYGGCKPSLLSISLNSVVERAGNALGWALAAPYGLTITHPFFDSRVLRVGLGLLTRFTPQPQPLKPVLALATDDLLPQMIRERRGKGHFNEVYYLGLSRNTQLLETMIKKSPCDDLGLVHKPLLIEQVSKAALGSMGVRPLQHFNLMVSLLKWLEIQETQKREPNKPNAVYRANWQD